MIEWVNTILQGVMLGGLYALFAMGLSLMFGVMRLTNVAHGDFIILTAFAAFAATASLGINLCFALLLLLPLSFVFGYALQRGVLNGTLGNDPLPSLVVTFGVSIIIQNLLMEIFSADTRSISALGVETKSLQLAEHVFVGILPLIIFSISVSAAAVMQWLFGNTAIGRAFRATSDDKEAAQLMGIDHRHVYGLATAIAFVLIAIAGVLQGMRTTIAPADGPGLLLYAFEAVIIGGMGSFWGTFSGAIILGVAQAIGFRINPGWGILVGHFVFLAMLVVKPNGLFPKTK
jgi:branched-chain amino acid transport system permease protein